LNATAGNIHNDNNGAIYAAGNLSLTATGNIINDEDATIDGDADFTASGTGLTSRFTNQGQINIGGNATINARNFENVMAGAENLVREWRGLNTTGSSINQHNYTTANETVPDVSTTSWYYDGHGGYSGDWFDDRESAVYGHFYRKEFFQGIADAEATFGDKTKPQISATNLTVSGFDSGRNVGGLMTATDTLTISGASGSSTFLNDSMALGLEKWNYQATWWYEYTTGSYDWWNPTGGNHITNRLTTLDSAQSYFSIGAGIRAGTLIVANVGALTNMGSPFGPATDALDDQGEAFEIRDTGAAGTNLSDAGETTTVGLGSASMVNFTSRSTVAGAATTKGATLLSSENAKTSGAGKSNSLKSSDEATGGAADRFTSRNAAAFANALKNAKISLNGLTLNIPSNPNSYFVSNADPKAKYLVNVNASFGIDPGSAVGSDELFKQLGADPDNVQKRLGDAAYETYLVRQQLVDQLGTKFLDGQKNEADQMAGLMANAATEARRLGLQIGVAPSPAQLANLTEDMVWMVEQEVAGERVLVPQVYLSSKTRGLFDAGTATLAGDKVEMDVGSLANTGGTISGSDSLSIKAKDDITNLSGNISGGDVSLNAGGSIINETTTRGNADSTVVGRTAGITATGDLDLDAGKDIKIIGGDVKAAGDASIAAGGEIVVDTVQKKTTTRTTEASSGFIGSSKTTTTTVDVENQASNLDFGGNVKIKSGGDTTIAGSNLNVGGNLDADVGGNLNVLARQDQHTVNTESSTSGVGVGGGIYGSQTTTTNDFTGTN
ncbi:MAG TPA: hemagglutinin repeat-containing protein, partial [Opitutus sp.]|nr:hemagglutinin repeat-containing protein [Opitutus sp.]